MGESRGTTVVAVVLASIFGLIIYWGGINAYAWDFHQFYAAGQLPAHQIYDVEAQYAAEMQLWKDHRSTVSEFNFSPFLKPAYYRLALVPLAKLSFWNAYWVFVAFQAVSFIVALYILHRRFNLEAYVLFLLPMCPYVGLMLVWGQDTGFVFLCVVLALELTLRDRHGLSGAVLAVGLIKWNQLLLFPVMMLVQRRTKMFTGFTVVALVEIALSIWIPGRDGLLQYLAEYNNEAAHFWETSMQSLYGLLLAMGTPRALGIGLTLVAAGTLLYQIRKFDITQTFAALGVAGPLLALHTMGYDLMFALVPIVILGARFRNSHLGVVFVLYLSPLPYFVDKMWAVGALRTMMFLVSGVVLWSLFRHDDPREPGAELQPAVVQR